MVNPKSRYLSVRLGGEEVYTEAIPTSGRIREHVPAAKLRLREIQRVMPMGAWTLSIEQQWKEKDATRYQTLDVITGRMEESVL